VISSPISTEKTENIQRRQSRGWGEKRKPFVKPAICQSTQPVIGGEKKGKTWGGSPTALRGEMKPAKPADRPKGGVSIGGGKAHFTLSNKQGIEMEKKFAFAGSEEKNVSEEREGRGKKG